MIQDPQAKRGVPEDGPASKDENYSSGKGKDKKIESESKLTKEQWLHMVASPRKLSKESIVPYLWSTNLAI